MTRWLPFLILPGMCLFSPQDKRAPIPDEAAEGDSERTVRTVFKDDFAQKTSAGQSSLARKLLQRGIETEGATAESFVCFREARDLAVATRDPGLALQVISEWARRFEVNSLERKRAALVLIGHAAETVEEWIALANGYLALVNEAVPADDYVFAGESAEAGVQAARKAKDPLLSQRLESLVQECVQRRGRAALAKKAGEALKKDADDPAAHGVLGHYQCTVRADWNAGLPHLAKSGNPAVQSVARKDLGKPSEAPDQAALGDAWWELADRELGEARRRFVSRAAFWYAQARERLTGPVRERIERRIEAAASLESGRETIDLLKLVDPKKDTVAGEWVLDGGTLVCRKEVEAARLQIPYIPPEEYDVLLVAERKWGDEAINLGLSKGTIQFHVVVDGFAEDGYMSGLSVIDGKLAWKNETTRKGGLLTNDRASVIECAVRKTGVKMSVDGQTIFDWSGDFNRLTNFDMLKVPNPKAIYVSGWGSRYRFSKLTLTAVTGKGERLR